jgi:hypothetical protein
MGARTMFIDSIANARELSISAGSRLASPTACCRNGRAWPN